MPLGIKLISILFVIIGSLSLVSTIITFSGFRELLAALERGAMPLPVYLLTNVFFPAAMIAGGVGLWRRATWAWWVCVVAYGLEISKKTILAFLAPHALLGTYPLKENLSLVVAIVVLVYLFSRRIFRSFHGESLNRAKALGVLVAVSSVVGGLFMWQAAVSSRAVHSNISLQATPKDGPPELKR